MFLDFSFSDNTIGYIVEGKMGSDAILELKSVLLEMFEEHDSINLYLEDNNIESFSFDAIFIGTIFPYKYAHKLNKVAMVTNRKWIHRITSINKIILAKDFKNFAIKDRLDAMSWVASD